MPIRSRRLTIAAGAACALALAVDMIEMAIGNAFSTVFLAPPYEIGPRRLSILLSSVYLGAVLGAPVFGWFADRRGIRSCLVFALGMLGGTSLLAAASPSIWLLTLTRFLSGFPLGAIPPLLIAYLTQIAEPRRRGLVIFWVCGLAALAPPFALMTIRGLIPLEPWGIAGWRWPLAGAGALSLVAALAFLRLPTDGRGPPPVLNQRETLRQHRGRLGFISAIYFLFPWAAVGFPLLTGPMLLLRGFDVSRALLYVTLTTLGPTLASLITGAFVDRLGRRTLLIACAVLMVACVLAFGLSTSEGVVAGALVTFGVAGAIYVTALTLYAAEIFPGEIRTLATSTAWACNRGAAVLVPLVLFLLIGPKGGVISLLPIAIAMVVSVGLIGLGPKGAARQPLDRDAQ
ncbi:MAG: MFS transporter [Steroidobacteraceae bacterium]